MGITQRTGAIKMNIDWNLVFFILIVVPLGLAMWGAVIVAAINMIQSFKR